MEQVEIKANTETQKTDLRSSKALQVIKHAIFTFRNIKILCGKGTKTYADNIINFQYLV